MSLLYPALFSAALEDVPDHERSQAVGTFSLFFDLSQGIGAPLLGLVVALSGERAAFVVAALDRRGRASGRSTASASVRDAAAGAAAARDVGGRGRRQSRRATYPRALPVKAQAGRRRLRDVDDAALVADELGVVADAEHVARGRARRRPTACSGGSAPAA